MADLEVFVEEVRPFVPKADDAAIEDAVRAAARKFCTETWYVRRNATFLTAAPTTPQNVSVVAGNAQATLSWDTVDNANSYTVNVGTVSGHESPNVTLIGIAGAVVLNLTNGTPYFFTVQAVNGVGSSPASSEVTATPSAMAANTPATGAPLIGVYKTLLDLPINEEAIGVRRAQCATFPMAPASAADMDPKFGPGRPRGFTYTPIGELFIYPVPNAAYQILAMVATQPIRGANQIADEIAQKYSECITYGALERLYRTPKTPWFDMELSAQNRQLFWDDLYKAKTEAMSDFQSGNMRVQPAPFIIRSIV